MTISLAIFLIAINWLWEATRNAKDVVKSKDSILVEKLLLDNFDFRGELLLDIHSILRIMSELTLSEEREALHSGPKEDK